jgi:endo-alpha-1,4-polygalactosaminidase (GH114 family)
MIDAEFRSEERFSRLSLAYEGENEKNQVTLCVERIIAKHKIKPETYTTCISKGREVLVIEYHDDNERKAGDIFEEMMDALKIKKCI